VGVLPSRGQLNCSVEIALRKKVKETKKKEKKKTSPMKINGLPNNKGGFKRYRKY